MTNQATHCSNDFPSKPAQGCASSDDSSERSLSRSTVLDEFRRPIEAALTAAVDFDEGCPNHLGDAMRYALLTPGKRLRPILVLFAAEACWGKLKQSSDGVGIIEGSILNSESALDRVMPGAVAVEMIHAYSLIHDDLPAMDDDDLRRGRPTVHIQFDEATAILAGDALQAEAFRHLCTRISDPVKVAASVAILADAAGSTCLVGGQADDLKAEIEATEKSMNTDVEASGNLQSATTSAEILSNPTEQLTNQSGNDSTSLQYLESIHRRKTGALFSASLDLGAVLADANEESRSALSAYAASLGLAFQVVDDCLDYTANAETLGKRAGKDADRGKLTYPGLLGIDGAKKKAVELIESAKQDALFFGPASVRLLWLADYVLERTH